LYCEIYPWLSEFIVVPYLFLLDFVLILDFAVEFLFDPLGI